MIIIKYGGKGDKFWNCYQKTSEACRASRHNRRQFIVIAGNFSLISVIGGLAARVFYIICDTDKWCCRRSLDQWWRRWAREDAICGIWRVHVVTRSARYHWQLAGWVALSPDANAIVRYDEWMKALVVVGEGHTLSDKNRRHYWQFCAHEWSPCKAAVACWVRDSFWLVCT